MALLPVYRCHLYTGNDQQGLTAALTYAWMQRIEAASGIWASQGGYSIPPASGSGSGSPGYQFRITDSGYTCPTWYLRKAIRISSTTPIGSRIWRIWNGHIGPPYPGWNSQYAYSPWALDLCPAGTSPQTGVVHAVPYFQFSIGGGGTYDAAIDWYHNINQHWYEYEIAYDTWYFLQGTTVFAADATGSAIFTMNGAAWFTHSGPTYVPGVPGYQGTLGQNWVNVWEGGYQACGGNYSLEREGIIDQTVMQAAQSSVNRATDAPTINFGDHSIAVISGSGTSGIVATGTTIDDAGFAGVTGTTPSASVLPSISGNAEISKTLTAADGTWLGSPSPSLTRKWQTSPDGNNPWTDIAAATATTYSVLSADLGKRIRVVVTGTNTQGSATANSAATPPVTATTADSGKTFGHTPRTASATAADLSANFKRGNEYYNPTVCSLASFGVTLQGSGVAGTQTGHATLYRSDGTGVPTSLVIASADTTVNGTSVPTDITLTVASNPILTPGYYVLAFHTGAPSGASAAMQGFFDAGIGLLLFNSDTFADGSSDPFGTATHGDGVMALWANVTPLNYAISTASSQVIGADGGIVSFASLEGAADDTARAVLLNAVNPSRTYTVHRYSANTYTIHQRKTGVTAPPANWWNT